ncbi:MAG: hypothetical protein NTV40_05190 [Solirubrobacterales bacterium]|nr:hypothetical protein [Solirubrobacterales bacterium]
MSNRSRVWMRPPRSGALGLNKLDCGDDHPGHDENNDRRLHPDP